MSPELIVFLAVFIMPGAVSVFSWDYFGHRRNRPTWSLYGWGLVFSTTAYAVLQGLGLINLDLLLDGEGKLSLEKLLTGDHMWSFVGMVAGGVVVAGAASAAFHGSKVQKWLSERMGSTHTETVWHDIARSTLNSWVRVELNDGRIYQGCVERVSATHAEGFVVLGQELFCWVDGAEHSLACSSVALKLADVKLIMIDCGQEVGDVRRQEEERAAAEAEGSAPPPRRLCLDTTPEQAPAPEPATTATEEVERLKD